jgi:hypothetical protein
MIHLMFELRPLFLSPTSKFDKTLFQFLLS